MDEYQIWRGKTVDGLCKDIYNNQRQTQTQISVLIDALKPLIKTAGDAAVIVPLIRDYLDVSVKNDSHLVRLAAVIQKFYATERLSAGPGGSGMLSDAEKDQLIGQLNQEIKQIETEEQENIKKLQNMQPEAKALTEGVPDEPETDSEEEN